MDGKIAVYVWPDGQWCRESELEGHAWKSDDYHIVYIPEKLDDNSIEAYLYIEGCYTY